MDKQLERFPGILTVGVVGMFMVGLVISVILPLLAVLNEAEDTATVDDLSLSVSGSGFEQLAAAYPDTFEKYWAEGATPANYADALERGRNVYIENACFQCHTQQVRLFSFEQARYGSASTALEQQNDLMHPSLAGNRRIGPDLARLSGDHDAAWYVAYFWEPTTLNPASTMPSYRWLYDKEGVPNEDGFALIAYLMSNGDYQPVPAADDADTTESEE